MIKEAFVWHEERQFGRGNPRQRALIMFFGRSTYDRVAFTPPGFLNRREWRPQSQPQDLQYHSIMPSHSSRSASAARPASIARC
jgi:hypothetical protein